MALSERSRSVLYHGFMSVVDDEQAVQEMMAFFPARDVEEPVTRDFLHAELAGLRIEMAEFRTDIRTEMDAFRTEMRSEMDAFRTEIRTEMQSEIGSLRTEMQSEIGSLRTEMQSEIGSLRTEMHRLFGWNAALLVSLAAVIVAAVRI